MREGEPQDGIEAINANVEKLLWLLWPCTEYYAIDTRRNHSAPRSKVQQQWLKPLRLFAGCHPARQSFLLPAAPRPCQSSSIVQRLCKQLLNSFIALSHCFQVPFSTLLLLSHSHIVPSQIPCCDICCCLCRTPPGSEPRRHSVLVATSLVLRTPLDYSGTSVYRPIGVLVCEPPKGQVAPISNMAPFYLWLLYLLHCDSKYSNQYAIWFVRLHMWSRQRGKDRYKDIHFQGSFNCTAAQCRKYN